MHQTLCGLHVPGPWLLAHVLFGTNCVPNPDDQQWNEDGGRNDDDANEV